MAATCSPGEQFATLCTTRSARGFSKMDRTFARTGSNSLFPTSSPSSNPFRAFRPAFHAVTPDAAANAQFRTSIYVTSTGTAHWSGSRQPHHAPLVLGLEAERVATQHRVGAPSKVKTDLHYNPETGKVGGAARYDRMRAEEQAAAAAQAEPFRVAEAATSEYVSEFGRPSVPVAAAGGAFQGFHRTRVPLESADPEAVPSFSCTKLPAWRARQTCAAGGADVRTEPSYSFDLRDHVTVFHHESRHQWPDRAVPVLP